MAVNASGGLKAGDRIGIDGKGGISVHSQGSGSAGGHNAGGSGHHGGNGGHYSGGSRHVCTGTIGGQCTVTQFITKD